MILISGSVNNFASGQILAPSGNIHIGAGTRIRLAAAGEPRITVIEGAPTSNILNEGTISAAGAIDLAAFAADPVPDDQRNPVDHEPRDDPHEHHPKVAFSCVRCRVAARSSTRL